MQHEQSFAKHHTLLQLSAVQEWRQKLHMQNDFKYWWIVKTALINTVILQLKGVATNPQIIISSPSLVCSHQPPLKPREAEVTKVTHSLFSCKVTDLFRTRCRPKLQHLWKWLWFSLFSRHNKVTYNLTCCFVVKIRCLSHYLKKTTYCFSLDNEIINPLLPENNSFVLR